MYASHAPLDLGSFPAARVSSQLPDFRFFQNIPSVTAPWEWRIDDIRPFASKGSAGIDGWSSDHLCKLDACSLSCLCALYNEANKGRFPKFWCDAKVTGIPKKGSTDYRPLTIMSATYRVWARRQAYILGPWFNAWAPRSIYGGRIKIGAADAASLVSMRCERSRLGIDAPLHAASTDMEKYFDRLLLPSLRQLATTARLPPSILAVLDLYANLRRHVFLDGSPTQFVPFGPNSCGVPQGCPLACLFTNLASAALAEYLASTDPDVELFSYLDDRVYFASPHSLLEGALARARDFDLPCGCTCNTGKSFYACFRSRPLRLGPILASMQRARSSFACLGIDIVVRGVGSRKRAKDRVAAFTQRCSLVSVLPAAQRPLCTADAFASLWCSAGSTYTMSEFSRLTSAAASALRPHYKKGSQVMLRSRMVEQLVGTRFHRTHPPAAAVYDSCCQLARLFRLGLLVPADWQDLWEARSRTRATHLVTLRRCSKFSDLSRRSHLVLESGRFCFSVNNSTRLDPAFHAHHIREVIRTSARSSEARRRPKDLDGAEGGIHMELARSTFCRPYGPALVTAGAWTAMRLYIADLIDSPLCVRCGACADSKEHRLWWCDDNSDLLQDLLSKHPSLDPSLLPSCLRRCGLAPLTFDLVLAKAVVNYLVLCNTRATSALAQSNVGSGAWPPDRVA